jgi:hypothetical protein
MDKREWVERASSAILASLIEARESICALPIVLGGNGCSTGSGGCGSLATTQYLPRHSGRLQRIRIETG